MISVDLADNVFQVHGAPWAGEVKLCKKLGRPIRFFITVGQVSTYTEARALVKNFPATD